MYSSHILRLSTESVSGRRPGGEGVAVEEEEEEEEDVVVVVVVVVFDSDVHSPGVASVRFACGGGGITDIFLWFSQGSGEE